MGAVAAVAAQDPIAEMFAFQHLISELQLHLGERSTALAGRGLERRPRHLAGGRRPTRGSPEERANAIIT
ncbi:MAG: hypothetical protein PHW87_10790 [Methanothrix sp.]|nr:hypothetical protein [Methanothrix sp.]